MTFFKIFNRWFVHQRDRSGVQPEEDGKFLFSFEGDVKGALCVNGRSHAIKDGAVANVRVGEDELSLEVHTPDGKTEAVETLVLIKGRLFPQPLDADAMLLLLAERLQALEIRVDQEENEINNINKKRRGALYLGGAEQ